MHPEEYAKGPNDCSGFVHSETTKGEAGFSGPIWPWQTTRPTRPVYPVWTKAMEGGL